MYTQFHPRSPNSTQASAEGYKLLAFDPSLSGPRRAGFWHAGGEAHPIPPKRRLSVTTPKEQTPKRLVPRFGLWVCISYWLGGTCYAPHGMTSRRFFTLPLQWSTK